MLDSFDLSGKVAVITGGNGGLGLGIAKGLAKAGASVAIVGRNEDKLAAASKELEAMGAKVWRYRPMYRWKTTLTAW